MSETPRTDRMVARWPLESFGEMTGLARQLERENAALRAEVKRLREALQPAWIALDRIDANPNDMETRRHAEVAAFYAIQRARAAK